MAARVEAAIQGTDRTPTAFAGAALIGCIAHADDAQRQSRLILGLALCGVADKRRVIQPFKLYHRCRTSVRMSSHEAAQQAVPVGQGRAVVLLPGRAEDGGHPRHPNDRLAGWVGDKGLAEGGTRNTSTVAVSSGERSGRAWMPTASRYPTGSG
jgi:hypothetical protein